MRYGKKVNADPTAVAVYDAAAKDGQSGYNVAVADFFNAPGITSVDVSACKGKVGDLIKIQVTADFAVKAVRVQIEDGDTTFVETGEQNWTAPASTTSIRLPKPTHN